jgi:hypothetical protein
MTTAHMLRVFTDPSGNYGDAASVIFAKPADNNCADIGGRIGENKPTTLDLSFVK